LRLSKPIKQTQNQLKNVGALYQPSSIIYDFKLILVLIILNILKIKIESRTNIETSSI
jgi:hypothetical protein